MVDAALLPSGLPGRAIVLYLSHFNASRRARTKFESLFHALGCDVVTCQTKDPVSVFRPNVGVRRAKGILRRLRDLAEEGGAGRDDQPIVIASFSGASKTLYWPIVQLLCSGQYEDLRRRVAGQVFDSCPIEFARLEGLDLLTKTNQLPKPLRDAPWVLRPLVNLGLHAFSHSVDILLRNSIKEQHAGYWADITAFAVPTLVLYSKRDEIVRHETVERYCELAAGDLMVVEFTGESKHVDHHAKEPETYERELGGFLARALSRAKL